jgi:hypothetical protein
VLKMWLSRRRPPVFVDQRDPLVLEIQEVLDDDSPLEPD